VQGNAVPAKGNVPGRAPEARQKGRVVMPEAGRRTNCRWLGQDRHTPTRNLAKTASAPRPRLLQERYTEGKQERFFDDRR